MASAKVHGTVRGLSACTGRQTRCAGAYPPPPGADGAGLADLNEEPPTLPPDRAARASSGDPALMRSAAATAAVSGIAKRLTADSARSSCGGCALQTAGRRRTALRRTELQGNCWNGATPVGQRDWTEVSIFVLNG